MKKFETPTVDIEEFNIVDVITTSGECPLDCSDDTFACPVQI